MNPLINPGDKSRRSSAYRAEIKRRSLDRLIGASYSLQGHQLIVDDTTAERMADALAAKNPGQMREALGTSVDVACAASMDVPLDTYTDEWNEALSIARDQEVTLYELITSGDSQDFTFLKQALQDSRRHQLALQTDSYVRLLHTIALATIPDNGYRDRLATNQRERRKQNITGVHATAMNILNGMASQEPGLGFLREGILDDSQTPPLDRYLTRLQQSLTAQLALAHIIELQDPDTIKSAREAVLQDLSEVEQTDYDKELETHLLTWEILPHTHDSIADIITKLKKRGKGLAKTKRARESFEQNWDQTRLEALFSLARQEAEKGRHVEIYISSAFNNSQEFYVAAEFEHTDEPDSKIVIADNPMTGNALYLVDEENTALDDDGARFTWQKLLGRSKKVARLRGAKRRFHVGEWERHAENFCIHGIGKVARKATGIVKPDVETESEEAIPVLATEAVENLEIANEQMPATSQKDVQEVLKKLDASRRKIDELYKQIIDKKQ